VQGGLFAPSCTIFARALPPTSCFGTARIGCQRTTLQQPPISLGVLEQCKKAYLPAQEFRIGPAILTPAWCLLGVHDY
jgi:hypothetical protein